MRNFFTLFKSNLVENYRLNRIFKKENVVAKIFLVIGIILLFLMLGGNFALFYVLALEGVSSPLEGLNLVMRMSFTITSIGLIITSLTQAYAYLFKGNDFEFLVSLPVSFKAIVSSKIGTLLLTNYLMMLLAYVPAFIVLGVTGIVTSFWVYFLGVIIFIFFPLGIVSVFTFISYGITLLFRDFKYKNILIIALVVSLLLAYMYFSFDPNLYNGALISGIGNILEYVNYPAIFALRALAGNILDLLLFVGINLILFVAFIIIMAKLYLRINAGHKKVFKNVTTISEVRKSSQTKKLIKSELSRYFSIPNYVINTIFGKLLFPFILIIFSLQINNILAIEELQNVTSDMIFLLFAGFAIFSLTLTSSTTVSLSLEGREFWIIKTSPIAPRQVFFSKMSVDLLTTYIPAIIGLIVLPFIVRPFDVFAYILLILTIFLLGLHNAVLGILVNLRFPKMTWDLPIQVIKQSFAVLMHMLLSFILLVVMVLLTVFLLPLIRNVNLLFLVLVSTLGLIVLCEFILLERIGPRLYARL